MTEFRKLADGVYAFLQPPLVWYSNSGVIIGDQEVIVVDSLTNATMTQALLAEIRRVTDKPIRYLINIPIEIFEVARSVTWPRVMVLVVNLGVVGYLLLVLRRNGRNKA